MVRRCSPWARRNRSRKSRSGYALIVALFAIAATMAASAMIAGSLGYEMWLVRQQSRDLHLTAIADAALAQTLAELSVDDNYSDTGGFVPYADGTLAAEVGRTGLNGAVAKVWATYGGGRRAAIAEIELRPLRVINWRPAAFEPAPGS